MKSFARLVLIGLALALPGCGVAVAALIDEVSDKINEDDNETNPIVAAVGLVGIDLATGDREVVSDADVGNGAALVDPRALAFDADGHRCLVWDEGRGGVVGIDVLTGDRTLLSSDTRGSGPTLSSVRALAYDWVRDRVLAADVGATETVLMAIDPATGDRSLLGGAGTALELPRSMVVDGDRALVGDASLRAILSVDLVTGDRVILSDAGHGQGSLFVSPSALARMGGSLLVLDPSLDQIFTVDLASGDRAVVSGGGVGVGAAFGSPVGLVFDGSAWKALVTQQFPSAVMLLEADPLTGDRGVVSSPLIGLGPVLAYPAGTVLDAARARVIVLNRTTP